MSKDVEFFNEWKNKKPGKYWKLPSNKKHLIENYFDGEFDSKTIYLINN